MSKHTPGPWKCMAGTVIVTSDNVIIGVTPESTSLIEFETTRDNAKLMAAAPELLEACHALKHIVDGFTASGESRYDNALSLVKSAIAKAEGHA